MNSNNSVSNNSKFDVRAPPRRRAKKDAREDQPIFLRKAYAMVSACPADIGGWSEKGDTVIIKNVKAFSEKIIPTAYKHNNFSSFVRQLNFYGFRKVKSESLQNPDWWEFRHPSFLRGKPHLLSEIKRSMHFGKRLASITISSSVTVRVVPEGNGNTKEITELKSQVADLTEKLSALNDQVERLTGAFNDIHVAPKEIKSENSKKRKVAADNFLEESIELRRMSSLGSQLYVDEFRSAGAPLPTGSDLADFDWKDETENSMELVEVEVGEQPKANSEEQLFEEIVDDLIDLEKDGPNLEKTDSNDISGDIHNHSDDMSQFSNSISEVSSVIDKLPQELQLRFVDKLAEVVGVQLASAMGSQTNAPVVKAEVPDSSEQSKLVLRTPYPEYVLPSGSKAPEIALPLASAAISAFLMSNFRALSHGIPQVSVPDHLGAK